MYTMLLNATSFNALSISLSKTGTKDAPSISDQPRFRALADDWAKHELRTAADYFIRTNEESSYWRRLLQLEEHLVLFVS